ERVGRVGELGGVLVVGQVGPEVQGAGGAVPEEHRGAAAELGGGDGPVVPVHAAARGEGRGAAPVVVEAGRGGHRVVVEEVPVRGVAAGADQVRDGGSGAAGIAGVGQLERGVAVAVDQHVTGDAG